MHNSLDRASLVNGRSMKNRDGRLVTCSEEAGQMSPEKPHRLLEWPFEFRFKEMDSDVNPFEDMEPEDF